MKIQLTIDGTEIERSRKFLQLFEFVSEKKIHIDVVEQTKEASSKEEPKPTTKPKPKPKVKDKTKRQKTAERAARQQRGAKLRFLRTELGLTQRDLAELTKSCQGDVSKFERGEMGTRDKHYKPLSQFLEELEKEYRTKSQAPKNEQNTED